MRDRSNHLGAVVKNIRRPFRVAALFALWEILCSVHNINHQSQIILSHYVLTFDEPFNYLDVSALGPGTRWIAHTPWAGDFGDAQFSDPKPDGPFSVANGILRITMKKVGGVWSSGLLASADPKGNGFSQSGGYFEIRAKLPPGPGVWPAFWLGAIGTPGKAVPEMDIFEYYGKFPGSYRVTTHLWLDGKDLVGDSRLVNVPQDSLTGAFHTYGVSIDKDFVIYYLDRKEMARIASRPEYLHPVFILVNLAAGSGWPIDRMPDPSVMEVDYIRAYRPKSG